MRNNRRAGKPAGRKPDKTGLLGLFTKGKDIPTTAQQTLPYREMYRDGVCRVADCYYTKTIEYEDINYQLAQSEDQAAIFDGWSACLNYFDSSLPFQLSFLNHRSRPGSRYSVNIPMQDDDYNSVRCEYVEMLENQIAKSNNGIVRTKLLTFGVNVDDLPTARARLERVEADICGNFKKLGVKCRSLSGLERLELLHGQLHPGSGSPFRFSWDMIPKTGLSTKDFIAPDSFDFRFSRLFRVGTTWGAASYLQILASELSDKLLAELLEMDAEMTITLHIQTVDQAAAVKSIKALLLSLPSRERGLKFVFPAAFENQNYQFASAAKKFHLIEENTVTVFVKREQEAAKLLGQIRNQGYSRTLMRQAGQYCINIYDRDFEKLNGQGALRPVSGDIEDFYELVSEELYTEEMGLKMDIEEGIGVFW